MINKMRNHLGRQVERVLSNMGAAVNSKCRRIGNVVNREKTQKEASFEG